MADGNIEEYIKWKRKNDPGNKSTSAINHHKNKINNSPSNNKFNNGPNQETSTSLKEIEPRPLNKKKNKKNAILNTLDFFNKMPLSLRKKATEKEKREATAQVKNKKTPQSLKPDKLRHGKRKSRLKFRQNVKIKNQVTTNRKKRAAEAKKKPVKENFPMSEEDKNYILTGKDRPTEESIKKKVKAAKAKDSVQELKETGVNAKVKKGEKPKKKDYLTGIKEHGPLEAKHAGKVNLDEFKKEVKAEIKEEGKKGGKPYILTQEDKDYINALSPAAYRNLTGKYRPGKKPKDKLIKAEGKKGGKPNPNPKYRPGGKPEKKDYLTGIKEHGPLEAKENKPLTKEEEEKRLDAKAQKNYRRLIKEGPWW